MCPRNDCVLSAEIATSGKALLAMTGWINGLDNKVAGCLYLTLSFPEGKSWQEGFEREGRVEIAPPFTLFRLAFLESKRL